MGKEYIKSQKEVVKMLLSIKIIIDYIKYNFPLTTLVVFIFSGIYLLIIDRADLSTKGLKRELKVVTAIGVFYIFGAMAVYVLRYIF